MKKKTVLRILICLLVVAVLVIGAYAGLLGARKARSMWARLLQEFQGVQAKTEKMVKELQTDMHFLQGRYSFDYTWTNWPNPPPDCTCLRRRGRAGVHQHPRGVPA